MTALRERIVKRNTWAARLSPEQRELRRELTSEINECRRRFQRLQRRYGETIPQFKTEPETTALAVWRLGVRLRVMRPDERPVWVREEAGR